MINGVTQQVMTKADVLDSFDQIQAATTYLVNGQQTEELPFDLSANCPSPVYTSYEGWKTDLTAIKNYADFPTQLRNYIETLEQKLDLRFSIISVGPGRDQLVLRKQNVLA